MERKIRQFLILLLTFSLLTGGVFCYVCSDFSGSHFTAFASDGTDSQTAEEQTPALKLHPGYKNTIMKQIRCPFLDTATVAYTWTFPYSDAFFKDPSDLFSVPLARASLGLAITNFRSTTGVVSPQYKTFLSKAGYVRTNAFGYSEPTTQDSLSGVIGMKKIGDFTMIAVATCGQGYQNEWAGNLIVGDGVRHEGFNNAAELLEQHIDEYIKKNNITGKKKIWLCGISRAGAIANITAADLIESGEYEDVYAYLYGVPRTTKKPVKYPGIYNICGQFDPVPSTPLQSWGYERYGTDLYTPSQESNGDYAALAEAVGKVSRRLTDKDFRNNPENNYQLRLILEFLGEFFPTGGEYAERFQDILVSTWKDPDSDKVMDILTEAVARLNAVSSKEETGKTVFIDYLSFMAGEHLSASQGQVNTGGWAPDEPLAANLALEHRPSTYLKWIFSDIPTEQLFPVSTETRKLVFIGNIGVKVYSKDGEMLGGITPKGRLLNRSEREVADEDTDTSLFMMRNGSQTVFNLPEDEEYRVEISAKKFTNLTYYDQHFNAAALMERPGIIHIGTIGSGACSLTVSPGEPLGSPEKGTADFTDVVSADFKCMPSVIMANELDATKHSHLSISTMIEIVSRILQLAFVTAIVCIIISVVHRRKIKEGHPVYSDWYTIIPHLLFIIIFMGLTQYITFFLFTIGRARSVCATITMLLIFLLALHGLYRYRNRRNAVVTAVMLALVPLTRMYYLRLPIDTFSVAHMLLYFAITLLLAAVAASTFRYKKGSIMGRFAGTDVIGDETPAE